MILFFRVKGSFLNPLNLGGIILRRNSSLAVTLCIKLEVSSSQKRALMDCVLDRKNVREMTVKRELLLKAEWPETTGMFEHLTSTKTAAQNMKRGCFSTIR